MFKINFTNDRYNLRAQLKNFKEQLFYLCHMHQINKEQNKIFLHINLIFKNLI